MAINKEARLTLKLEDQVTKPSRAIVAGLNRVNATVSRMSSMSMAMSRGLSRMGKGLRAASYNATGLSAPMGIAGGIAARAIYDYEKAGNKMQAFGLLMEDQRKELEKYAQALNKDFPFTNKDILRAAQELFRAGLTYEQSMGALRGSLNLALAGDIDVKEATDIATNIMTAMKLPMETFDQVQASLLRVNDALAYAATNSNTDVKLMGDTFRYVAPLAAAAGMELEEVTALSMELARAGIKGSEAGVALRSALVRMAKPTKPMLAAFERLNVNIKDFIQYRKDLDANSVIGSLMASGYDLEDMRSELEGILSEKTLQGAPARMVAALTDAIVASMGDEAVREDIANVVTDAVTAGAQRVDLVSLLTTLRDKGATITDISQIFDVRMGSRLAAILHNDLVGAISDVKKNYRGVAAEMSRIQMQGIVGSLARIFAALENFSIRLAKSGVLDTVGESFDRISEAVDRLSQTNPRVLELATYSTMALVALAPMGLALSGLAATASLLVNPLAWIVGGLATLAAINLDPIISWSKAFGRFVSDNLDERVVKRFDSLVNGVRRMASALAGMGADGEAWGRTAKRWGEATANAINTVYDVIDKVVSSRFASGFMDGLAASFETMRWAAEKLAGAMEAVHLKMGPFFDFLNSNAGERLGEIAGQLAGYAGGLALSALAIGLVAGPVLKLGRALAYLSGIKLAWGALKFIGRIAGLAGSAAAIGSLGGSVQKFAGSLAFLTQAAPAAAAAGVIVGTGYVAGQMNADNQSEARRMATHRDAERQSMAALRANADAVQDEIDRAMMASEQRAARAGQSMEQSLNITATPNVNTSALDRALAVARNLHQMLLSLDRAAVGATGSNFAAKPASQPTIDGKRAAGGPMRAGLTYQVGEKGIETVTVGRNSYVTPNHRLGGGPTVTNHFHIQSSDPEAVARQISRTLDQMFGRSRELSIDGRPVV